MKYVSFLGALGAIGAAALVTPNLAYAGADDPVAAEDVAAAAAGKGTSAACFNEGFVNKGTQIDFDLKVTGDGATPPRRFATVVTGQKKFNGVKAVETAAQSYDDAGNPASTTLSYSNLKGGKLLNYGLDSDVLRQIIEPSSPLPTALKMGKTFNSKYEVTNIYPDGRKEKSEESKKYKFDRFESLKFKVGKFKACRFTSRISTKSTGLSILVNKVDWVAAEGKYRGLTLRTVVNATYSSGLAINQQIDVTKVRKFKIK